MERKRLVITGRVQGVGFRMTTRRVASGFAVSGYVRNLDDGGVELVVEGPPDHVADFVAAVRRQFADNIEGVEEGPGLPSAETFSGFTIRH